MEGTTVLRCYGSMVRWCYGAMGSFNSSTLQLFNHSAFQLLYFYLFTFNLLSFQEAMPDSPKHSHCSHTFLIFKHFTLSRPIAMFQYEEPGIIISFIRKKWLMLSKAWMAPARLTAMTAAPGLYFKGLPAHEWHILQHQSAAFNIRGEI